MTEIFLETYFNNLAAVLPAIGHTDNSPAFYRIADNINLDEFDNAVRNMLKSNCLLLEIGDGEIADWDTQRETPRIGLHVLCKTDDNLFSTINAARDQSKTILLKIVARIRYDTKTRFERRDNLDGPLKTAGARFDTRIKFTNMSGIDGNWYGKSFYFEFKAPINLELNVADWEDIV